MLLRSLSSKLERPKEKRTCWHPYFPLELARTVLTTILCSSSAGHFLVPDHLTAGRFLFVCRALFFLFLSNTTTGIYVWVLSCCPVVYVPCTLLVLLANTSSRVSVYVWVCVCVSVSARVCAVQERSGRGGTVRETGTQVHAASTCGETTDGSENGPEQGTEVLRLQPASRYCIEMSRGGG